MDTDHRHLACKSFGDSSRVDGHGPRSNLATTRLCFGGREDDFVLYESLVNLLRERFGACNSANEESALTEIAWLRGTKLVAEELVCLPGSEVKIVYRIVGEVREGIVDQAIEQETFSLWLPCLLTLDVVG